MIGSIGISVSIHSSIHVISCSVCSTKRKRVSVTFGDSEEAKPAKKEQTNNNKNDEDEEAKSEESSDSELPYINSVGWYSSAAYKALFASKCKGSRKWIKDGMEQYLDSNYNQYDDANLEQLVLSQPDHHEFSSVVREALSLLNEWRKWRNTAKSSGGKPNEWKLSSSEKMKLDQSTDTHLKCYWNSIESSSVSATKGTLIMPYPAPIISGVIENSSHECKYEEYSDCIHELKSLSTHCGLFYAQTKTPMFMTERDLFGVAFNYVLPNAEIIMVCILCILCVPAE